MKLILISSQYINSKEIISLLYSEDDKIDAMPVLPRDEGGGD